MGVCTSWGNMFALDQNRISTNDRNQCRGEPFVRPPNKNLYQTYYRQLCFNIRPKKCNLKFKVVFILKTKTSSYIFRIIKDPRDSNLVYFIFTIYIA